MRGVTATVALVNAKGGVGKTTVTLGLASAAQHAGQRVLVVDMDPQGAATWALGLDPGDLDGPSTADLVGPGRHQPGAAAEALRPSSWGDEVWVLPAAPGLQDQEHGHGTGPETRLRRALEGATDDVDLVLVDCAPSLGNLTVNALAASTHAMIVVEPAALSLRGIGAVADLVDDVWDRFNQGLDLAGVVVNRVPGVSSEAERRYEELTRSVGRKAVWQPVVPQRVVVPQAVAERAPIHAFGHRAADVIAAFDQLYAKLRRVTRAR
jgi:cellulose biosynthesis protein BcsQ